jgi:hypothetical protein
MAIKQVVEIRCPTCDKGTLYFMFDEKLAKNLEPVIIAIRCVNFDTATLSTCKYPTHSRLFNEICKMYYLEAKYAKDIFKIHGYTVKLHEAYSAERSRLTHRIYSEMKSLDERRSTDTLPSLQAGFEKFVAEKDKK